jgi:T4 RnlA family RNA ligase
MMKVQEFIKLNGVMALADAPLNIKVREYPEAGYFMLNYDQIESPKSDPISMECRSLIVDKDGNVISRSFDRFFNFGEMPEFYADFDISRAVVATKYDGSLIKVYWSPATNRWEISTRSQAFGEGPHAVGGIFRDWVLKAMGLTEARFQDCMYASMDPAWTAVMEYTAPENRIVTRYEVAQMVLLAVRKNETGEYTSVENMDSLVHVLKREGMNVVNAATFPLASFEDIVKAAEDLPTLEEGFVCWDPISNKRVKIKASSYVAIHHLRDNGVPSAKRIYTLVLVNEQDEYLSYFPEDRKMFEPIVEDVEKFRQSLIALWPEVAGIEDQKEFALKVKDHKGSGFFFTAKKLKVSVIHAFDEAPIEKKIKMFNIKQVIEVSE